MRRMEDGHLAIIDETSTQKINYPKPGTFGEDDQRGRHLYHNSKAATTTDGVATQVDVGKASCSSPKTWLKRAAGMRKKVT